MLSSLVSQPLCQPAKLKVGKQRRISLLSMREKKPTWVEVIEPEAQVFTPLQLCRCAQTVSPRLAEIKQQWWLTVNEGNIALAPQLRV